MRTVIVGEFWGPGKCAERAGFEILNKVNRPGFSVPWIASGRFYLEVFDLMYLLTWNPDGRRFEATFGGIVTPQEADRFLAELLRVMKEREDDFRVMIDLSTVHDLSKKVERNLLSVRKHCLDSGAEKVTYLTGDLHTADTLTSERMSHVLEGLEQYLAYPKAA